MDKEKITGQIMTRPAAKARDGKSSLVIVYGIVCVPEDSPLNKEGMQFIVSQSMFQGMSPNIELTVHRQGVIDRSEEAKGMTPDGMICQPIWRF